MQSFSESSQKRLRLLEMYIIIIINNQYSGIHFGLKC